MGSQEPPSESDGNQGKKVVYRKKEKKRNVSKRGGSKKKNTLSKWKYQEGVRTKNTTVKNGPVKYYDMVVEKYGKPDLLINKQGGLCIWSDYKKIKPHKSILLMDEYVDHDKPKQHFDFLYSYINIYVPPSKLYDVLSISGSVNYDPLKKELFARCGSFEANFATLRTVFNVINNKKTEYGQNINNKDDEIKDNEKYVMRQTIENRRKYRRQLKLSHYSFI